MHCAFSQASTVKAGAEASATSGKANAEHNLTLSFADGPAFRRGLDSTSVFDLDAHGQKEVNICVIYTDIFCYKNMFQIPCCRC